MRQSVLAAGAVLTVLALGGCAASADRSSTSGKSATTNGAPRSETRGLSSGVAADPSGVSAPGGKSGPATQQRVAIGPTKIYTAELTLRAKSGDDVAGIATRATDLITAAGGSLAGDRRTEAGSSTQADLILKVPPEKYTTLLGQLAKLGKELSRSAQAEDVTDQVIDVASRVGSQETSVARIRKLLAGAKTLGEVVQIEGELARREADLESLKARQRALDGQTSMATITLHVRGPAAAVTPPAQDDKGFVAGLKSGWHAFTAATTWLLTAVGALLPFLILAALVLAAVTYVRRRRGPRHPSPSPDPQPAAAA